MVRYFMLTAAAALLKCAHSAMAQDLAAGKKLFTDNCVRCHGAKGQGGIGKKLWGMRPIGTSTYSSARS